jgi:hypothetical protein
MNEVMTIAEIQESFDSERVMLGEPVTDETLQVQSGRLLAHSRNRDDFPVLGHTLPPSAAVDGLLGLDFQAVTVSLES